MAAPMTDSRPVASPVQYSLHDGHQPAPGAPRTDSFVGLPPIRRTSTFGLMPDRNGQSDEGESPDADSFHASPEQVIPPVPAIPSGMVHSSKRDQGQVQYNQVSHQQALGSAAPYNPHGTPQGNMVNGQNGYHQLPHQNPSGAYPAPGRNGAPAQFPGIPVSQFSQFTQYNTQVRNGFPSSPGLPGIQTGAQPGVQQQQQDMRPGPVSPPSAGGNPIHRFPPQGQWKLEESQLSEPLNTSRKTQTPPAPAQQAGYYAGDKETESLVLAGPSQPPQRIARNAMLPPVTAQRYPALFPAGSSNQSPVQQDHLQIGPAAQQAQQQRRDSMGPSRSPTRDLDDDSKRQPSLLNQIGGKLMPHRGRPDSISKDGIQADEISVSETSILTDDDQEKKHKRASFFGIGMGNNGQQPQSVHQAQQIHQFGPGDKKKTFFGVAKQIHIGGNKNENSSGNSDTTSNQGSGPKKRLSDLKGMFKTGPKDDMQFNKAEIPTSNRPSMQSSVRPSTDDQALQSGPAGMMAPPSMDRGRSSTQGSTQRDPMGPPPSIAPLRAQHTGDGTSQRAASGSAAPGGGFLGNIFGNKPGSGGRDQNTGYSPMPTIRPGQQFPHGQAPPSNYQTAHQMGLARNPVYPPGQLQGLQNHMRQASNPAQPGIAHQQQPGFGQPTVFPSQKLHDNARLGEYDPRNALDPDDLTPSGEHQRILGAPNNDSSPRSSGEFLRVNRKPVGSGPSRLASGTVVAAPSDTSSQSGPKSDIQPSRSPEPPNEFGGDGQEHSGIHQTHQNPNLGVSAPPGHMRQPSLPTPSHSPAPPGSPGAQRVSAQSVQSGGSPYFQQQGFNDGARVGQSGEGHGPNGVPMPMRSFTGQPTPGVQNHPGQAGRGQQDPSQGPSGQHTQPWGFTRTATQPPMGSMPAGKQQLLGPGQGRGTNGPVQEQKGTMSKLFGVGRKRDSTSPQPPLGTHSVQTKEKESTSSKILSAFKRSSKQQDPSQIQQPAPPQGQPFPSPMMQGGRGQMPNHPNQPGQAMPAYMTPAGRGQSPAPGPAPQGSFGAPGQPRASPGVVQPAQFGRGQASPPIPGDRGQLPSQATRVGHGQISPAVLPMMQSNRSQTSAPKSEPQYAAVPIPRGYEAVHGYGVPNMIAHSPYNVGRGSPPQALGPQFQSLMPQYTGSSQQLPPMMPQHTGSSQQVQQMAPQPAGGAPADRRWPSPAPSQQTQAPSIQPQEQIQPHPVLAGTPDQTSQDPRTGGQALAQQLIVEQSGSPDPQRQFAGAQGIPVDARNSPHPRSERDSPVPPPGLGTSGEMSFTQDDDVMISITRNEDRQASRLQPQQLVTNMGQHEIQHNASPQNQPLPDSATTFSPINAATGRLSDPPLPPVASFQNSDRQFVNTTNHTPSPLIGAPATRRVDLHHMTSNQSIAEEARQHSLSREVDPRRHFNVSPEPPRSTSVAAQQQLSNPSLNVNVNQANSHTPDHDDMYDATPRSSHPSRLQQVPMPETASQHPDELARHNGHGAAVAGGAVAGLAAGAGASISRSSSYQDEASQPPAPVQTMVMEPEEKILVDQPVELAAVNDDGDDLPTMSATSYPGQEWNPYGAGEFGDFD